jgi:hypothetical protein
VVLFVTTEQMFVITCMFVKVKLSRYRLGEPLGVPGG